MFPDSIVGKEKMEIPVVIPVSGQDGVKSNTKKYTIIGVSVVLVIAIIVGGFVGGMFLMQKSSNNMIEVLNKQFTDKDGKQAKETVKVDIKNQVAETDVKKEGSEVKIISDLKRGITVTRSSDENGAKCFVSVLNTTTEMDLETMKKYKEQHPNSEDIEEEDEEDGEQTFTVAEEPIKDISFLGSKVQEMCEGLETYWMYPEEQEKNVTLVKEGDRKARHATTCSRLCPSRYGSYRLYACSRHQHLNRYYCRLNCYYYAYFCRYQFIYRNRRWYIRRYCYRRNIRVLRTSRC